MKKYAMGGRMMRPDRGSIAERRQEMREIPGLKPVPVRPIKDEEPVYKKGGKVKSGSSASKRADGIASKGKTKGKMIKMRMGGKC